MSYIAINGNPLPPPKRGVKPTVTTLVDAARNGNGVTVGQVIGRNQYKLDTLEWPWLSAEEWHRILNLMKPFYFNVTFDNPETNGFTTILMYCGNRTAEPYWVDGNGKVLYYRNCKANLIDTGM